MIFDLDPQIFDWGFRNRGLRGDRLSRLHIKLHPRESLGTKLWRFTLIFSLVSFYKRLIDLTLIFGVIGLSNQNTITKRSTDWENI